MGAVSYFADSDIFRTFANRKIATYPIMAKKKNVETKPVAVQGNEAIAKCDNLVPVQDIEGMIFTLRGVQVMLDRDLAFLYGVTTGRMNEQVKRNSGRFPESFRFQLTAKERDEVIAK